MNGFTLMLMATMAFQAGGGGMFDHADVVSLDDLYGTDTYPYRLESSTGFLGASGDFDGDGSIDMARFERDGDTVYLIVHAPGDGSGRSYILRDFIIDDLWLYGIASAPAGTYRTSCDRGVGDRGMSCLVESVQMPQTGLQLIAFEKSVRLFYWDGDGFSSVFIAD